MSVFSEIIYVKHLGHCLVLSQYTVVDTIIYYVYGVSRADIASKTP